MNTEKNKISPAVRLAAFCLRIYQFTVSPIIHAICGPGAGCRFEPTCSCYAKEALEKHGLLSGGGLALRRICRCQPWQPGGYDPVPDLKTEKNKDIAPTLNRHLNG